MTKPIFNYLQILIMKEKDNHTACRCSNNAAYKRLLMMAMPIIVAVLLLFVPVPDGLPPYAWHYFAIFVGVIVGLIFEPLPAR
jgi:L-tartrate/succinate antiporter